MLVSRSVSYPEKKVEGLTNMPGDISFGLCGPTNLRGTKIHEKVVFSSPSSPFFEIWNNISMGSTGKRGQPLEACFD